MHLPIPHPHLATKIWPRANEDRLHGSDPALRAPRRKLLKAAAINFVILQILFLGLFSYIFGSLFQQNSHIHNLGIVFVDYDGGIVGDTIRDAYSELQGPGFPTLTERSATDFPTPQDLRDSVCKIQYWAALYTQTGASSRLEDALSGSSTYNTSDVLAYIWNEARYSAITDSLISANIQTLSLAARTAYVSNETQAQRALSANSTTSISVFANPWQIVSRNIMPTAQGSRLIYNSLVIVLVLIQEFFYLGTVNGLYVRFNVYAKLYPHRIVVYRFMISTAYTFVGSLTTAGAIWAFKAGWAVNSNQFALTWAALWLFAHINFMTLDVFTIWLAPLYVPMALAAWLVFNVSSILLPFELMPSFYHWAYVMPANELYRTLTDIWSGGCSPQLRYSLPILFALEISSVFLSSLGVYRRSHQAVLAGEAQEKAFRERLDAAIKHDREREQEIRQEERFAAEENRVVGAEEEVKEEERDEEKLAGIIRREDRMSERERTRMARTNTYGPAFQVAFADTSDETLNRS